MASRSGPRILIRPPAPSDQDAFLAAACASRRLHHPWVSAPVSKVAFRTFLERADDPAHASFLICDRRTGTIAGVVNVSHIVRGAFRSAYLGYYVFAGSAGCGYMRAGLRAVVRQAFGPMGLHRLEANVQPGNGRSRALVKACGFTLEGYSPRYLKIGGRWRDHERWAIRAS